MGPAVGRVNDTASPHYSPAYVLKQLTEGHQGEIGQRVDVLPNEVQKLQQSCHISTQPLSQHGYQMSQRRAACQERMSKTVKLNILS